MATGESMPVNKRPGDELIGATVNQVGLLKAEATRVGKDTFLAQVIKMVEEAQGSKVPIQEFADRITSIFVPVIIGIAVLTVLAWVLGSGLMQPLVQAGSFLPWVNPNLGVITLAIVSMVAVLVIACPCALGLATPTALMVGSGIGAEHGILIRSGEAIQTFKDVQVVVFDKTGTITKGKPEVTDVVVSEGFDAGAVLRVAASVERGSEHPLGRSIVEQAEARGLTLSEPQAFQAVRGKGVSATIDGIEVLVGSRRLMAEYEVDPEPMEGTMQQLELDAKTAMLIAVDGALAGVVAVADTLKEDSADAIREVAELFELSPNEVYEVASFYTMFYKKPVGKYVVQVCTNISCLLCHSEEIMAHLQKRLGVKPGETTADEKFTLIEVECLASCGTAPVVQINEDYHENLTVEKLDQILNSLG
jgi:Cu+-exporting ATPase